MSAPIGGAPARRPGRSNGLMKWLPAILVLLAVILGLAIVFFALVNDADDDNDPNNDNVEMQSL